MSSDAIGWVFRYSPLKGTDYAVHLAMADSANDQHDYEVWLSNTKTAAKSRCSVRSVVNAKATIVELGLAELVDGQHGLAGCATYRMLFPDIPVVYDSKEGRRTHAMSAPVQTTTGANDDTHSCNLRHPLVQTSESSPITNSSELKEPKGRSRRRSGPISDDFAVTHEMRQWAAAKGIRSDPMAETEKFVNHFRSRGTLFADPIAAWRNWMIRADDFARSASAKSGPAPTTRSKSLQAVDSVLGSIDQRQQEALPS